MHEEKASDITTKEKAYRMALSLFCGYEHHENEEHAVNQMEMQKNHESRRRIENFYSLNQTKSERLILNVNLIIILSIAIGLFIFFSIPPQLHIFKNIKVNNTYTS
jgi:hypothetical protein